VSSFVFAGLMLYYHVTPTRNILMLPVLIVLMTVLTLSIGMWTAAVNVRFRDVGVALPVLVQLWMFTSPVVYPSTIVFSRPLAAVWLGYTCATALLLATVITIVLFVYSSYEFRRLEATFADVI